MPHFAINLLNWREAQIRKQARSFAYFCLLMLLLTAGLFWLFNDYQQLQKEHLAQYQQQHTALRLANQQLQQQIQPLQQQTASSNDPALPIATTAVMNFIDFLTQLPLQNGRLTYAAFIPHLSSLNLKLHGYTHSHQEFEHLKHHFEQALPQAKNIELTEFEFKQQQLLFEFMIQLPLAGG